MRVDVLQRWLIVQAVLWLGGLVLAAVLGREAVGGGAGATAIAAVLALSFAGFCAVLGGLRTAADAVTAGRFVLLAGATAAALASCGADWTTWALLAAAIAADLADGAVARRFGGREAGAVLDMETDQLATLALAFVAFASGAGVHVLCVPAYRHAWVLAQARLGTALHDPKPRDGDNRVARRLCALMMAALLAACAPGVPPPVRAAAAAAGVLALAWSYSGDVRHVLAGRARRAATLE